MKEHIGTVIAFIVGMFLLIFGILFQDVTQIHGVQEWLKALSNAALLAGVLLMGIGLLTAISQEGFFDGMRYAISSIWADLRNEKKRYASYFDYINRENKKSKTSSLLIPGLVYLLAAIIFTVAFYMA